MRKKSLHFLIFRGFKSPLSHLEDYDGTGEARKKPVPVPRLRSQSSFSIFFPNPIKLPTISNI